MCRARMHNSRGLRGAPPAGSLQRASQRPVPGGCMPGLAPLDSRPGLGVMVGVSPICCVMSCHPSTHLRPVLSFGSHSPFRRCPHPNVVLGEIRRRGQLGTLSEPRYRDREVKGIILVWVPAKLFPPILSRCMY